MMRLEQSVNMQIHTPRQLVAAIPHLIGFHPTQSLVLVVIDHTELVAIARIDLPERQIPMPIDIERALASTRKGNLVLMAYSDFDMTLDKTRSLITGCDDLDLLDALWIRDGHWSSLMCSDLDCCPEQGHPLSELSEVDVEFIVAGSAPFASRDDLVHQIEQRVLSEREEQNRDLATDEVAKQIASMLKTGHSSKSDSSAEPRNTLIQQVLDSLAKFQSMTWIEHARLCKAVCDIRMRDGLLRTLFDRPQIRVQVRSQLMKEISRAQIANVPALATVLAGVAWLDGNGALATIAIERALDVDPSYSLARLLNRAISHGVPPSVWADSLEAVSYQECLAGVA